MCHYLIKLITRQGTLPLIAACSLWLAGANPALAQMNACALTGQLVWIETAVFDLQNNDAARIESQLKTLQLELDRIEDIPPLVAQITGNPDWLDYYLQKRGRFLSLYIAGQYIQANDLKNSSSFRDDGRLLDDLRAALYCAPEGDSLTGVTEGNIEENKNSKKGLSQLLRALGQAKTTVAQMAATNWLVWLPFLLLVVMGVLVWIMIRYDEHRRSSRRRFFCQVDVSIQFNNGNKVIQRQGQIVDISRRGAGLLIDGGVPVNAKIQINTDTWQAPMKVIRVNGRQVGAEFLKILPVIPLEFDLSNERKFLPRREYLKST